ncbi:MAG TPA: PilZ domain-containing protein [Candidatus Acidoferrum sp.]|nr:PilZ domain-containing protein [Candidatus Acidoferrum sp.]
MKPPPTHRGNHPVSSVKPGLTRPLTSEERRRAQRVLLKVPVRLTVAGKKQSLEGTTHTVSATGALVVIPEALAQGTKLTLENATTQKKIEAHVPRPPQFSPDGSLVAIEFASPAPNFWNVFFPPVLN